jgi:hypothetical protein
MRFASITTWRVNAEALVVRFLYLFFTTLLASCALHSPLPVSSVAVSQSTCALATPLPASVVNAPIAIFGELHGTHEIPGLIGEIACSLSERQAAITVALEIPNSEQLKIDAYLASAGSSADRRLLLASDFWTRPIARQDGRSSQAMVELLERLRQLQHSGHRIKVLAMDGSLPGKTRDAAMADRVRDAVRSNAGSVMVLTGNIHAIKRKGAVIRETYEPLAYLLSPDGALSFEVIHKGGTAWVCRGDCGSKPTHEHSLAHDREPGFYLGVASDQRYDGSVVIPVVTASPPANPYDG